MAGDDALGCAVVRRLAERLGGRRDLDLVSTARGALHVAEAMLGYDRAIVVDARLDESDPEGLHRSSLCPSDLDGPTPRAGHDGSLIGALRALCALRAERLPDEIVLLSWPISGPIRWAECLSPSVAGAVEALARAAMREVEEVPVA